MRLCYPLYFIHLFRVVRVRDVVIYLLTFRAAYVFAFVSGAVNHTILICMSMSMFLSCRA